jgi:hypothetical protein
VLRPVGESDPHCRVVQRSATHVSSLSDRIELRGHILPDHGNTRLRDASAESWPSSHPPCVMHASSTISQIARTSHQLTSGTGARPPADPHQLPLHIVRLNIPFPILIKWKSRSLYVVSVCDFRGCHLENLKTGKNPNLEFLNPAFYFVWLVLHLRYERGRHHSSRRPPTAKARDGPAWNTRGLLFIIRVGLGFIRPLVKINRIPRCAPQSFPGREGTATNGDAWHCGNICRASR